MIAALSFFMGCFALAYGTYGSSGGGDSAASGSSGGTFSAIGQTQERRSVERFNILDYIRSQQAAVNAQNSRWGHTSSSHGPYPDFSLNYAQDSGPVTRDSANLGQDTRIGGRVQFLLDDLFTQGSRTKLLNIDLGGEGFMSQTTQFAVEPSSSQVSHSYTETGGGLIIRPIGRSSQDTGLMLKGGYLNINETGLWNNSQTQMSLYGPYVGAETKLYLLKFLGLRAEYLNALETSIQALQGKWKMQRFTYGAFLEIYLLNLEAHMMSTEMVLTPDATGTAIKENYTGAGLSVSLYF